MNPTLHDLRPDQLIELLSDLGEPGYRGRQLAQGLYARGAASLDELTDLPATLRSRLSQEYGLSQLEEVDRAPAEDATVKHLFELHDGKRIESVAITMGEGRRTFCLSSQVGCAMACIFCATARMGLVRNLDPGEIVGQVLQLKRLHPTRRQANLVFMGMGEPLDNFEHLAQALAILSDPEGMDIGARHITVSTAGVLEGIQKLGSLGKPYGLALSLTTAGEEERRRLMPVAGQTPLDELLAAAAEYGRSKNRKVTLECALIAGENDDEDSARRLLTLARQGPFKVNLIPLNPIDGFAGQRPTRASLDRFAEILWEGGVVCTVRDSAGREVTAACGQLVQRQRKQDDEASDGMTRPGDAASD